ncbi:MAG: hypothetical protein JNN06_04880 [Gemmobacter sp.]|uniref:hypothetical protein n=1 Tax=Gemmobacter sp. TaxID=1898957 RepID=UPI001A5B7932|nr:hypothetical protein [Gemmobacter sp.]MBL8561594.1 hypothetical protein [Gemmobacter sp.]
MNTQRRLALAVSLLAVGLGAGHLVQSRAAKPAAPPAVEPVAEADLKPKNVQQLAAGSDDLASPLSVLPPVDGLDPLPAAPALKPAEPKVVTAPKPAALAAADCDMSLDLLADSNAMIGITVIAPCRPNQRVMVKHGGLAVTGKTSASGTMFMNLPAMEVQARIELSFPDGEKLGSTVEMPEVAAMQRFAVQWLERDAFQLQAFENGADYGQPGHVSAVKPQTPAPGLAAQGGFVTLLGDETVDLPMLAEVYTFPAKGEAEVLVEAAVTPETCGRELLGETVSAVGGKISVSELTLAMPECEAAGDILVLKNLVPEMKLAAR